MFVFFESHGFYGSHVFIKHHFNAINTCRVMSHFGPTLPPDGVQSNLALIAPLGQDHLFVEMLFFFF